MFVLASSLTLLAATAAAVAVVFLARKVKQHRGVSDRRIDTLADETYDRCLGLDRRADALGATLLRQERLRRIDHLLSLTGVAERSGRLGAEAARRLELAILDLHDDASIDARRFEARHTEAA